MILEDPIKKNLLFYLASIPLLVSLACGTTKFHGTTSPQIKTQDDTPAQQITWVWPCSNDTDPNIPKSDSTHLVIQGGGVHKVPLPSVDGAPVSFQGEICPNQNITRYMLFVVDVSGSTTESQDGTDIPQNGTCNRLIAVQSMIASAIKAGTPAKFAALTFSSDVNAQSSTFDADQNTLFGDLTSGSPSNIANVLCAGGGDTNYVAALTAGKALFDAVPSNQQVEKEMYFISDGAPTGASGSDVAAEIKQNASIATVMFGGGDDSILRNDIASVESNGQVLAGEATNSADLANVLASFVVNKIEKVSLGVRNDGTSNWNSSDVTNNVQNSEFDFEAFKVDTSLYPKGIDVQFSYQDKYGAEQVNEGSIVWTND